MTSQKVDKDYMNLALSMKCDKKDVSNLVDMPYYTSRSRAVDITLDDLRNKLRTLERDSNFKYAHPRCYRQDSVILQYSGVMFSVT